MPSVSITKTVVLGGVPTNVTAFTLVLVRTDTNANVPVTVVHTGTGVYVFSFTPPAPALTYLATFTIFTGLTTRSWQDTFTVGIILTAQGIYHGVSDVYNEWGRKNVLIWLDLDNDRDQAVMNSRLQNFINRTESYVNARLAYSPYIIPFTAPIPLEIIEVCAVLTGVFCYRPRSNEDFDPEKGDTSKSLIVVRKKAADKMIADILVERLIIAAPVESDCLTNAPRVVKTDHLRMRHIRPGDQQSADTLTDMNPLNWNGSDTGFDTIELTGG